MSFGVYIHFPWCRKRCPYCDFAIAIAPLDEIPHRPYADAVLEELDMRADDYAGRDLVSIYFGGGTPGLWEPACLDDMIQAVRSRFDAGPGAALEITLEVNPTDCAPPRLEAWMAAGVNRLSIGVQSFDADELKLLGRDHRFGDGARAVRDARAAGFQRLSVDVILGTPASGAGYGMDAVRRVADLAPEHLSVYELTIEERTPFGAAHRRGDLQPLDNDALADLYLAAHRELVGRGYEHYEISSYARPGCRAIHNSLYWHGGEYLGLGNGAASFRRVGAGGERATNLRSVVAYLRAAPGDRVHELDRSDATERATEALWLAMRTADGADERELAARPGLIDGLLADGLAERRDGRIRPTIRGFLQADAIAQRIANAAPPRPVTG